MCVNLSLCKSNPPALYKTLNGVPPPTSIPPLIYVYIKKKKQNTCFFCMLHSFMIIFCLAVYVYEMELDVSDGGETLPFLCIS